MVAGWVFGSKLNLNATSVAFLGFGVLLVAGVLTLDDISKQGDTLATFLWLAVLFAHERTAQRARLHGLRRRAPRHRASTACPGPSCT